MRLSELFEIFRTAFGSFAFAAFGNVFYSAFFHTRFHKDFAAAIGANEFLRCNRRSRVFTCSCHNSSNLFHHTEKGTALSIV